MLFFFLNELKLILYFPFISQNSNTFEISQKVFLTASKLSKYTLFDFQPYRSLNKPTSY